MNLADSERLEYFQIRDLERLLLVDIPYGERQQVSAEFRTLLFTITEEELDRLWDQDPQQAERIEVYRRFTQRHALTSTLKIKLTTSASEAYRLMRHENAPQAIRFADVLSR